MTPQEYITKMLMREGDCYEDLQTYIWKGICFNCNKHISLCKCIYLTTPDGAFWIMSRLEGWGRFEEFCSWVCNTAHIDGIMEDRLNSSMGANIFIWLASEAKDGKAPALFNALCEFEGLEVEG